MNLLIPIVITLAAFFLAYRFYGRWIAKKIFMEDNKRETPAIKYENGVDFVPSNPLVVFSHHFASIAGAGPIIGPALALSFGYGPVFLWIVIGSIFVGGIHDFTVMFASVREKGKSVAEILKTTLGKEAYLLMIGFTTIMLFLVTAVFLKLTVASLTSVAPIDVLGLSPDQTMLKTINDNGVLKAQIGGIASTSLIFITAFAPLVGFLLYKKNFSANILAVAAILICVISVIIGMRYPISINPEIWAYIIAFYTLLAAGIPVWIVLQPRDFINSFFLYAGIAVLLAGVIVVGFSGGTIQHPVVSEMGTTKIGDMWPFLFITVACGACSGFHALVAGGTSSKQVSKESDILKIGYGGMLLEGILAAAVVVAIGFALTTDLYSEIVYPIDKAKLSNPNLAFALSLGILGSKAFGLPVYAGTVLGILLLEGFLVTTLDTAVRLNRYLFEELWESTIKNPPKIMKSYLFNASLAVIAMLILSKANTVMDIWKVFGAANQLLAALSLLAVAFYLQKKGKNYLFALIPAGFMGVTTIYALVIVLVTKYIPSGNMTLIISALILLGLSAGVILISIKEGMKFRNRNVVTESEK